MPLERDSRKPGVIPSPRRQTRTVLLAGRYGLVPLAGELDLATAPAVRDAVRACLDSHPALLRIDISGVSFCDCSGLGALLWARAEAVRAGVGFHLSGPFQPVVTRILEATGTAARLGLAPQPAQHAVEQREGGGSGTTFDTAQQGQVRATSQEVAR
ncbi:STAS domain-containing protein [Streptomyces sp. NPDC051577]|uniref:STAS domain-containing protein n=1 Tax=Streptomyces sp. NPDC051577 TaxID=3155166 RepID=UPI003428A0CB